MSELFVPLDSYELATSNLEIEACDGRAFDETWQDMLRLQEEGVYPAAFGAIKTPVLMLHGVADPHPGGMIRASLQAYLPQLEYCEWERCGHYPWLEKAARKEFFAVLGSWLALHLSESATEVADATGFRIISGPKGPAERVQPCLCLQHLIA
jgi:pimeloyl-ACP methyl ester carboxylesterase